MNLKSLYLSSVLLVLAALGLGYIAGRPASTVEAQSRNSATHPDESALSFQFSGATGQSALSVYNANEHTLYVYQGIAAGSSHVNCSYSLHITRPGAPIDRQNCAPGSPF